MKKNLLVIIDGKNGAGKTTIARLLHAKMPFTALLHWDTTKKLVSGFKPNKKYHKLAKQIMIAMTDVYLKNGVNVIYEAHFGTGENVNEVLRSTSKQKTKVFVYQIEAPLEVQMKRVKERWLAGKTKRLPTKAHVVKNNARYEKYKYKGATVFDSSKLTAQQITNRILREVKK
jgi:adenylate kinase family enzyme